MSSDMLAIPFWRRKEYVTKIKNEILYRGILQNLLHPLGHPDSEKGLRPGDLMDHLREVFDVSREDHEFFSEEELRNRPQQCQVNFSLLETQNVTIPSSFKCEVPTDCSTYCLFALCQSYKGKRSPKYSPKHSPKHSPKQSPKHSPKQLSKFSPNMGRLLKYEQDVLKSQPAKGLHAGKWNEDFVFKIENIIFEELQICLCIADPQTSPEADKKNSLKNFFKNVLRSSSDSDCQVPGGIGRICIPIRNIPHQGWDTWFDIFPLGNINSRTRPVGECHLKLSLSYKQDVASLFTHEEYYQTALIVYRFALRTAKELDVNEFSLPASSRRLLDIFAISNQITKLPQNILELAVMLDLTDTSEANRKITDQVLHMAMEAVQQTMGYAFVEPMPLSDTEINHFCTASKKYIKSLTRSLENLSNLFPPSADSFLMLRNYLGVVIHILEQVTWDPSLNLQKAVVDHLLTKLQTDTDQWLTGKLSSIKEHEKVQDFVIPRVENLSEVIRSVTFHCTPLAVVKQLYNNLGLNFYRVVAFSTDKKVATATQELMLEMDKYQLQYQNYSVNITKSSQLSLSLYFSVRKLYQLLNEGLDDRDLHCLTISNYQTWFEGSLVFWLQTFKTECFTRLQKAVEIDKDLVLVTSLVKFSNSSVDVLSCFATVVNEWIKIGYKDPDYKMMGITKITDMICDGVQHYVDIIHLTLERNHFYEKNKAQFDITDQVCITLNNIEHVCLYLNELPELLHWKAAADTLSAFHGNESIGKQSLVTLNRLVSVKTRDIVVKSSFLLKKIAFKMKVFIQTQMKMFLSKPPEQISSGDSTFQYLSTNLMTLQEKMSATIYPKMIEEVWGVMLLLFDNNMLTGRSAEYYEHMKRHLQSLASFFTNCDLPEETKYSFYYSDLIHRLETNSQTTGKLIMKYFEELADNPQKSTEYLGLLSVRTAYLEETRDMITVYVIVLQAIDLPEFDPSGLCHTYVEVSLQPHTMFQPAMPQKTKAVEKTLQPVFNATFKFTGIPKDYLTMRGTMMLLSVLDYGWITTDGFAGEILIHLSSIQSVTSVDAINVLPVIMMPLKRPVCKMEGIYKVLKECSTFDTAAKSFIDARQNATRHHSAARRRNILTNIFSFFRLTKSKT